MAIYTKLPVYKASYSLMLKVSEILQHTPRDCRYTIGQELRNKIMNLILIIYHTNRLKNKADKILEGRDTVLHIQVYIRLMNDMRYISEKRYMDLVEMTSDISKQLSAWEKYERNKIKRGEQ